MNMMLHWVRTAVTIIAVATASIAAAQTWPSRPVTVYHGFLVGGNPDIVTRAMQPALAERLGQPIVVEPRPGAAGRISTTLLSKQAPDGYSAAMITGGDSVLAATVKDLPYDLLRDFEYVSAATRFPFLITVRTESPFKTVRDLIDFAKSNPGKLTYGHSGTGSTLHLAGELFKEMAGIDMLHVPSKGTQAQEQAAGQIDVAVVTSTSAMPFIRSGKIRVLAVTSPERSSDFPDAQAINETVPGYEVVSWLGLVVPAKTPAAIVERFSADVRAVLARDDVKSRLAALGAETYPTTSAEFRARVEKDIQKWRALAAKVKLD